MFICLFILKYVNIGVKADTIRSVGLKIHGP